MGMRSVREVCVRAETVLEILCCGFGTLPSVLVTARPRVRYIQQAEKRTPYNTPKHGRPLYHWRG